MTGKHYPFRKPNDKPLYIHRQSNHPPTIVQNLPASISRRLTDISNDNDVFTAAAPAYNDALRASGYSERLVYLADRKTKSPGKRRSRKRDVIWFNPPYSKSVATNIGQRFLRLVAKHFPKASCLHKILNKNTIKLSYSCMPNMAATISQHNAKILHPGPQEAEHGESNRTCNCRAKNSCPLNGQCLTRSVVYKATVTTDTDQVYTGLTEGTFKQRFNNHQHSMRHQKYRTSTELSKFVWNLKDNNTPYHIDWPVHKRANAYSNKTKRCSLCLAEKLAISQARKSSSLNKRSELVSKCRHENKYYLSNFVPEITKHSTRTCHLYHFALHVLSFFISDRFSSPWHGLLQLW